MRVHLFFVKLQLNAIIITFLKHLINNRVTLKTLTIWKFPSSSTIILSYKFIISSGNFTKGNLRVIIS